MKVIWSKEKVRTLDNPQECLKMTRGSGDSYLHCSVCGRACSPRRMRDICHVAGREVSYEKLVEECFKVKISVPDHPEDVICSACVTQILNALKFKQLVCAAFRESHKTPSESSSHRTLHTDGTQADDETVSDEKTIKLNDNSIDIDLDIDKLTNKEILNILNKKIYVNPKKERKLKASYNKEVVMKKTIVNCAMCGQKYPSVFRSDSIPKAYVCARCKLNNTSERTTTCRKCYTTVPMRQIKEHLEGHAKNDLKGRRRLRCVNNPQVKSTASVTRLSRLSPNAVLKGKKPSLNAYRDALIALCQVCGKNLGTRILLEEHMKIHRSDSVYKCDRCDRVFRSKPAVERHEMMHKRNH